MELLRGNSVEDAIAETAGPDRALRRPLTTAFAPAMAEDGH